MIDISADLVKTIHDHIAGGQCSERLLGSALSSYPYYHTDLKQIASVYRGLIKDHAFSDGNKRTATVVMHALVEKTFHKSVSNNDAVHMALAVATHNYSVDDVADMIGKAAGVK